MLDSPLEKINAGNFCQFYNSIQVFDAQSRKSVLKKQQNRRPDFTTIIELYKIQEEQSKYLLIQVILMPRATQKEKKESFRLFSKKIRNEALNNINQPTKYFKSLEQIYHLMSNQQNYTFNLKQKQVVLSLRTNQFCKKTNQLLSKNIQISFKLQQITVNVRNHFIISYNSHRDQQKLRQIAENIPSIMEKEEHKVQKEEIDEQKFEILIQKQQIKTVYQQQIKQIKQDISQKIQKLQSSLKYFFDELKRQQEIQKETRIAIGNKLSNFQSYLEEFTNHYFKKLDEFKQIKNIHAIDEYGYGDGKGEYVQNYSMRNKTMQKSEEQIYIEEKKNLYNQMRQQNKSNSLEFQQNNEQYSKENENISEQSNFSSLISSSESYIPSETQIKFAQKQEKLQKKKSSVYEKEDLSQIAPKRKIISKSSNKSETRKKTNRNLKQRVQACNVKLPKIFPTVIISDDQICQEEEDNFIQFQTQSFIRKGDVIKFKGNIGCQRRFIFNVLSAEQCQIINQLRVEKSKQMALRFGLSFKGQIQSEIDVLQIIYDAKNGAISYDGNPNYLNITPLTIYNKFILWVKKKQGRFGCGVLNHKGEVVDKQNFHCKYLKESKSVEFFVQFTDQNDSIKIRQYSKNQIYQ